MAPSAILEGKAGIVLFSHGGKSICGEKVYMCRIMIGCGTCFKLQVVWLS